MGNKRLEEVRGYLVKRIRPNDLFFSSNINSHPRIKFFEVSDEIYGVMEGVSTTLAINAKHLELIRKEINTHTGEKL